MRWIISAIGLMVAACSPADSDEHSVMREHLSRASFTQEAMSAVKANEQVACVEPIDDGSFSFGADSEDCQTHTFFTDNMYEAYLADPLAKDAVIARLVSVSVASLTDQDKIGLMPDDFRERIVVLLRPAGYGESIPGVPAIPVVKKPFAGDMVVLLALDSPDSLAAVTKEMLGDIDTQESELYALAFENTRERVDELQIQTDKDIEFVSAVSGLATGHLSLPESCDADTAPYYAVVLDRDTYARTPASATKGVAALASYLVKARKQNAGFSQTLLSCDSGIWSAADVYALAQ